MIKIENTEAIGWEHAIRGMRNPMNSWDKSDSGWTSDGLKKGDIFLDCDSEGYMELRIGRNDQELMQKLSKAGTDHRKFMRMIVVYADITAPLYWWKEFDTYKVGTVANSCSTMHKIHEKEFTLDDFSCEHLARTTRLRLDDVITELNYWRDVFIEGGEDCTLDGNVRIFEPGDKDAWWQMIQLLPSSYNQKRTVMLNYEALANIYKSRRNHKLDEWIDFCKMIEELPYSELITQKFSEK